MTSSPTDLPLSPAAVRLAAELERGDHGDLFNYEVRDDAIDEVWAEPDAQANLEAIVRAPGGSPRARFLASEVLFAKDFTFASAIGQELVAEIYAEALRGDFTGMANSWGLLYEHADAGPVGLRFLILGEAAVPVLRGLLEDDRAGPTYEGSEEATVGNGYHFRVKDFAAYYLGRIRRVPVRFHQDLVARDREIEQLERAL
jgi:hypothetical protein